LFTLFVLTIATVCL